eukprot:TRINITY_DN29449_c0_g1_i1.p1 TRINITY_DN29449_c0_g1~~TRINITY_DN29449_c0_g1_i1.p1  ORF type:complete len:904 (-),score=112.70 TRINITY_DN29449_c0_g1_i1:191-2584(-)
MGNHALCDGLLEECGGFLQEIESSVPVVPSACVSTKNACSKVDLQQGSTKFAEKLDDSLSLSEEEWETLNPLGEHDVDEQIPLANVGFMASDDIAMGDDGTSASRGSVCKSASSNHNVYESREGCPPDSLLGGDVDGKIQCMREHDAAARPYRSMAFGEREAPTASYKQPDVLEVSDTCLFSSPTTATTSEVPTSMTNVGGVKDLDSCLSVQNVPSIENAHISQARSAEQSIDLARETNLTVSPTCAETDIEAPDDTFAVATDTAVPGSIEGVSNLDQANSASGSSDRFIADTKTSIQDHETSQSGTRPSGASSSETGNAKNAFGSDNSWCATHFQYRWRCRQDGVADECNKQDQSGSNRSAARTRQRSSNRQGGTGNEPGLDDLGDSAPLGDEEMEDLEIQRMVADLEDERRDLRDELNRAKRSSDTVTPEMQRDVELLLEAFGIPFVHSPAEAEAQCCFLAHARLVDAVVSDDSDVLAFGAQEVYRRLFSEDHMVECYTSKRIEAKLGLCQEDFIILATLLGCDYTLGVHGVGIVNGLEIIRAFKPQRVEGDAIDPNAWMEPLKKLRDWAKNITEVAQQSAGVTESDTRAIASFKRAHMNYRSQWSFPDHFPNPQVYDAFRNAKVDRSLEPFSWSPVDSAAVIARVEMGCGISAEKLNERLEPALRRYTDTLRQPRITEYMLPAGVGDVAVVHSNRMRNALRGLRGEASPERSASPPRENADAPRRRRRAPNASSTEDGRAEAARRDTDVPAPAPKAKRQRRAVPAVPDTSRAQGTKPGWSLRQNSGRIDLSDSE